ncbi:MAG: hypothetical protein HYT03_02130 [Candidatus Harrisonbacteria bacterium]|nr:hypothetical protein [Candidatus Harrisonbacteria bacterium]
MRKDKEKAVELRRRNKSYNEIVRALGIPKGTLAGWFKNDKGSQKVKELLDKKNRKKASIRIRKLVAINAVKWNKYYATADDEAIKEFPNLLKNPLFVAGLMLYWGEGDNKSKWVIRLSNTDHRMIALYVRFLTKTLRIKKIKIKIGLILYPDLDEQRCVSFWSRVTNIPLIQFYKTQFIRGHHPTTRLKNGICMVSFSDSYLKRKVFKWIDLFGINL